MLLDKVFAQFLVDCREIEPTKEADECSGYLKDRMSQFYPNEHDCAQMLRTILNHAGFNNIYPSYAGKTKYITDGHNNL